eukprot:6895351-Pyramimonas_sp.AAC.1
MAARVGRSARRDHDDQGQRQRQGQGAAAGRGQHQGCCIHCEHGGAERPREGDQWIKGGGGMMTGVMLEIVASGAWAH